MVPLYPSNRKFNFDNYLYFFHKHYEQAEEEKQTTLIGYNS